MSRFTRELKEFEFRHNYSFVKPKKRIRLRYIVAITVGWMLGVQVAGYWYLLYSKAEAYDDIAAYLAEQTAASPILDSVPVIEP